MRTTLVLDDKLFKAAKKKAAAEGTTLSEVVNEALREALRAKPAAQAAPFRVTAWGDPNAPKQHLTPKEIYDILEDEEIEAFKRLGRR